MTPAPKFTIAKPNSGANSVSTESNPQLNGAPNDTIATARPPSARLKIVLRRLPPGLTQSEFENAVGDEWKLGSGKVDWLHYRPGKVSDDLSKPSRPSRAYLHLTHKSHLNALAENVRQASFADSRNTMNDPALLGPPTIEFAPYSRISTGKRRNDARQGTIDQDPEFIQFLESLTAPVAKPAPLDNTPEAAGKKDEKIRVTPLIQYLREKRAAKDKPTSLKSKHSRQESKNEAREARAMAKAAAKAAKASPEAGSKKSGRLSRSERPRELLKVIKKETAILARKPAEPPAAQSSEADSSPAPQAAPAKKKPAATPTSAVARMIQRDLGLKSRDRRRKEPSTDTATATVPQRDKPSASSQSVLATPAVSAPMAPAILKRSEKHTAKKASAADSAVTTTTTTMTNNNTTAAAAPPTAPSLRAPGPARGTQKPSSTTTATSAASSAGTATPKGSTTATQAFLKHANASQGITEPLIHEALAAFGGVLRVEIDRRKGFAYVDFATPAGLRNAIRASPVKVAQGSVQVLERKDRGGGGVGGGSAASAAASKVSGAVAGPRGAAVARGAVPTGPAFRGAGAGAGAGAGGGGGGSGGARGRGGRGGGARNAPTAAAATPATVPATVAAAASSAAATSAASPAVSPAAAPIVAPVAAPTAVAVTPTTAPAAGLAAENG